MSRKKFNQDAMTMIQMVQSAKISPQDLTSRQRKIMVKYIKEERSEWSNEELGTLIGCSGQHVGRIWRQLLQNASWEILQADIVTLAVALKKKKEELQRKAMGKGDYRLAWDVECEFIEKLQELGFVYRAPQEVNVLAERNDLKKRMEEFFDKYGVPSVDEFLSRLEKIAGGNGNERLLGPAPGDGDPDGGDREHPEDRPQDG